MQIPDLSIDKLLQLEDIITHRNSITNVNFAEEFLLKGIKHHDIKKPNAIPRQNKFNGSDH